MMLCNVVWALNVVVSKVAIAVGGDETLGQGTDYSYSIELVGINVSIAAASPFGVAYALETLSQFIGDGAGPAMTEAEECLGVVAGLFDLVAARSSAEAAAAAAAAAAHA